MVSTAPPSSCPPLSPFGMVVGWGLVVGIPAAGVPQVWKLLKLGPSGVSWLYITLSLVGGLLLFASRALLDFWPASECCVDALSCSSAWLKSLQLGLALATQTTTQAVFVAVTQRGAARRLPWLGVGGEVLLGAVVAGVGVPLLARRNMSALGDLTDVLAAAASVVQIVLYLPQLLVTWRERAAGSLSMIGLSIQTAGMVVLAADQCCDELQVFIPQMVAFLLSLALLLMCFYFEFWVRRSRAVQLDFVDPGSSDLEADELLSDLDDEDF